MIEVMRDIYGALESDSALIAKLAKDPHTGEPAIYTETAQDKAGPYLLLTFGPVVENNDAQSVVTLQVDVIDQRSETRDSIVPSMKVRDEVLRVLDRRRRDFGGRNIRTFYTGENPVASDSGRFRRIALDFEVRYNRPVD